MNICIVETPYFTYILPSPYSSCLVTVQTAKHSQRGPTAADAAREKVMRSRCNFHPLAWAFWLLGAEQKLFGHPHKCLHA